MSDEAKFRRELFKYRNATRCGNCKHFKVPMHCSLLHAACKSDKVCDHHTPAPKPAKEQTP